MISEKHFSWRPKKKRTSQGLLTHPTNKKFFWIFLTGTRTSYTRLFVVTTRTRTEKFLWRNSNGWWLGGGCETIEVDFWLKPIHTCSNMSKKQIESMMMKADLNGDGSVSSYISICQSVLFSGMLTMKNLWRWCKHKIWKDLLNEVLLNVKWLGSLHLYSVLVSCVKWSCEGRVNIFYFVHCSSVLLRLHQIPLNIMIWSCL